MKHLKQPFDSKLCGQTCVAMVLDTSLAAVVAVIGRAGTHYKTLAKAMEALGRGTLGPITQRRSTNVDFPPKGTFIARIQFSKKPYRSHFVVLKNGKVYDPGWHQAIPYDHWIAETRRVFGIPDLHLTSWAEYYKSDAAEIM